LGLLKQEEKNLLGRAKVLFVLGTRPEVIKLAPLILRFQRHKHFSCVVVNTGQHREMSKEFLDLFGIVPGYDLRVMSERQSLGRLTGKLCLRLEEIVTLEKPDLLIVQGDTTTAFCGALSAFYCRVSCVHIEAGLRTGNKFQPFPEEINRALVARLADLHCAPTQRAKVNLLREGIDEGKVVVTGNTIVDALQLILTQKKGFVNKTLEEALKISRKVITVTAHRRENWGKGIEEVAFAIRELSERFEDVNFFFSVHPNPVVKNTIYSLLRGIPNVFLFSTLAYSDFIKLLARSNLVISDSGGIQEEAPALGVPVLVTREVTERPELLEAGLGALVGCSKERIIEEATRRLLAEEERIPRSVFGDGKAAERIERAIENFLGFCTQGVEEFKG
jgi:UDP-N-acetylglucosamine 2-epimerase (non-hydrolysing)